MTILDILTKAGVATAGIIALLEKAAQQAPDLAPSLHTLIAQLQAAVDQANLVQLASALPAEIANIAKGKLDPRDSPSNLV